MVWDEERQRTTVEKTRWKGRQRMGEEEEQREEQGEEQGEEPGEGRP